MKGPRRSVRGFSFWWLALSLRDSIQAMSSAYRIIVPHDPAQFPSTALVTPRARHRMPVPSSPSGCPAKPGWPRPIATEAGSPLARRPRRRAGQPKSGHKRAPGAFRPLTTGLLKSRANRCCVSLPARRRPAHLNPHHTCPQSSARSRTPQVDQAGRLTRGFRVMAPSCDKTPWG